MDLVQINLLFANSYYDHNDPDEPIKFYLDISSDIYINANHYKIYTVPIVPTTINFLNGTSQTIYEAKQREIIISREIQDNRFMAFLFMISPEQYLIEQQINYQPVLNSRRMLDTTQTETTERENNSFLYNLFFVLSQLGGFYSFLKLIFSSFLNKIYESMLMVDFVNKYKENEIKSKQKRKLNVRTQRQIVEEQKIPSGDQNDYQIDLNHEGGEDSAHEIRYNQEQDNDQLIQNTIFQRTRFRTNEQHVMYSYSDGIKYTLSCRKSSLNQAEIANNKLRQFDSDVKKLSSEIDIMKIVLSIKETKRTITSLMKTILNIQESIFNNQNDDNNDESKMEAEEKDIKPLSKSKPTSISNPSNKNPGQNRSSIPDLSGPKDKPEPSIQHSINNEGWGKDKSNNMSHNQINSNEHKIPARQISNINSIIEREISMIMDNSKQMAINQEDSKIIIKDNMESEHEQSSPKMSRKASNNEDFQEFDIVLGQVSKDE